MCHYASFFHNLRVGKSKTLKVDNFYVNLNAENDPFTPESDPMMLSELYGIKKCMASIHSLNNSGQFENGIPCDPNPKP